MARVMAAPICGPVAGGRQIASADGPGWPPITDINHQVRIFDPDDCARYRAGIRMRMDRLLDPLRRSPHSISG
jgi:hypothetical protein